MGLNRIKLLIFKFFLYFAGLLAPEIFIVDVDQHTIVMEEIGNGRTLKQKIKELEDVTSPDDELKQICSNLGHVIGNFLTF